MNKTMNKLSYRQRAINATSERFLQSLITEIDADAKFASQTTLRRINRAIQKRRKELKNA